MMYLITFLHEGGRYSQHQLRVGGNGQITVDRFNEFVKAVLPNETDWVVINVLPLKI